MKLGRLGVWYFFDAMSSSEAATTAQKIESKLILMLELIMYVFNQLIQTVKEMNYIGNV